MVSLRLARTWVSLAVALSCLVATVSDAGLTCGDAGVINEPSPSPTNPKAKLPIFYFHGTSGNAENSANYRANLTTEGCTFVTLDFCMDTCTITNGLNKQVALGVAQVRSVIAANPSTFASGYHFIGHSQGGTIARLVIQEMDDHNVKTFVSLAANNGRFYGPQPEDVVPTQIAITLLGAQIPPAVFNISAYGADPSPMKGKFQRELLEVIFANPDLQATIPQFNQTRSPFVPPWLAVNTVLPIYNNLLTYGESDKTCKTNQKRYNNNFVHVDSIHLFASANDSVQAPYQMGLYGFYSNVNSLEEVETKFQEFKALNMTELLEYLGDTFGLKTMHEAGKLHNRILSYP